MKLLCPVCKKMLDKTDFYVNKNRRPYGLSYKCKGCHKLYAKNNRVKINKIRLQHRHKIGYSKDYGKRLPKSNYIKNNRDYGVGWLSLRKVIYERDNWTCRECGIKCHNSTKKKIQCHHIDYNTLNNNTNNLITLCVSCHAKTNFKRSDWMKYFESKIKEK